MSSKPLSFRITPDARARVEAAARELNETPSAFASKAVDAYLEAHESRKRLIETAFKQADKGEYVSPEAVRAWMQSLGTDNPLPKPGPDVVLRS